MIPGVRVTIAQHRVWNPSWGWLDAPFAGEKAEVAEVDGDFAAVRLGSGIQYRCALKHLTPDAPAAPQNLVDLF